MRPEAEAESMEAIDTAVTTPKLTAQYTIAVKRPVHIEIMIRPCNTHELDTIFAIINDGARAYAGVVPADCLKNPYMPMPELLHEIKDGVVFWGYEDAGELLGVMGIQELSDVTLIRHAYVRTGAQGRGIGSKLLSHLRKLAKKPLLIGTWADAKWAIAFYEKHGFKLLSYEQKEELLPKYWKIPQRQKDTSVVLASPEWLAKRSSEGIASSA